MSEGERLQRLHQYVLAGGTLEGALAERDRLAAEVERLTKVADELGEVGRGEFNRANAAEREVERLRGERDARRRVVEAGHGDPDGRDEALSALLEADESLDAAVDALRAARGS